MELLCVSDTVLVYVIDSYLLISQILCLMIFIAMKIMIFSIEFQKIWDGWINFQLQKAKLVFVPTCHLFWLPIYGSKNKSNSRKVSLILCLKEVIDIWIKFSIFKKVYKNATSDSIFSLGGVHVCRIIARIVSSVAYYIFYYLSKSYIFYYHSKSLMRLMILSIDKLVKCGKLVMCFWSLSHWYY